MLRIRVCCYEGRWESLPAVPTNVAQPMFASQSQTQLNCGESSIPSFKSTAIKPAKDAVLRAPGISRHGGRNIGWECLAPVKAAKKDS